MAHRFKILSDDFLTPPELFTVPLLGPVPPLPRTSLFPPGTALPEPSIAGLSFPPAADELRNPVRVPSALGFGGVGVCGKVDKLSERAWSADEAGFSVEEVAARCFPLSAELGVVKSISAPLFALVATGGDGLREVALPPPLIDASAETCITVSRSGLFVAALCDTNTSSSHATPPAPFAPSKLNPDLPPPTPSLTRSPVPPGPLTGLPSTVGKFVFLLARSPTLPKIPITPLPPIAVPPRPHFFVVTVDAIPVTVAARLSDDAVGRANVAPDPCAVGVLGTDASSLAFPFPLLFSELLSSPLDPSPLTNPKLVLGRLGGGTTSLDSA